MGTFRGVARLAMVAGALALGGTAHGPARGQDPQAVLGLAAEIVADGRPPWEDRPFAVANVGTIPGTAGVADPGDDLGPSDGVVRTYDAVTLRFSYSARAVSPERLQLTVDLPPSLAWEGASASRLRLSGCPGGVTMEPQRRRLTCHLGAIVVPPAVSGMIEAAALVRGSAPHGTPIAITATLRAANGTGDSDAVRCPEAAAGGCRAVVGPLRVSAAPGVELDKIVQGSTKPYVTEHEGVSGWLLPWRIGVYASGDGDARGNAAPVPLDPLLDWWAATRPGGTPVDVGGRLVSCTMTFGPAWTCAQPDGDGTPVRLTMPSLDPDVVEETDAGLLVRGPRPRAALSLLRLVVFVPEAAVERAGGEVTLRNCAATPPGSPGVSTFRPVDAAGNPNLGGLDEPAADNCAEVTLVAGWCAPEPSPDVSKSYQVKAQQGLGQVIADEAFESAVTLRHDEKATTAVEAVVLCDAFDNRTQRLDAASASPARGAIRNSAGQELPPAGGAPILEFAAGPWGTWIPPSGDEGRAWYAQATTACDAAPVNPAGWVSLDEIDPTDSGAARLDARDVNRVRVRFADPVPPGHTARLAVRLRALPNPDGTILINYGGTSHQSATATVQSRGTCYQGRGGTCPDPLSLQGYDFDPGHLGDALVLVGAPTRLTKRLASGGTQTSAYAGGTVTFTLSADVARTEPPLPPGVTAHGVTITDVLPAGMAYEPGSAVRAAEDVNRNGVLDPGEDVDGNGLLDPEAPLPPAIEPDDSAPGATRLIWAVGALRSGNRPLAIRYAAAIDPLTAGGTVLRNAATVGARGELDALCGSMPRHPYRCAAAVVQVVNRSLAAVDKRAAREVVRVGEPVTFQLRVANLMPRDIEWFDAVDILPWPGDARQPPSDLDGPWRAITVTVSPGAVDVAVWASAAPPEALDVAGGGLADAMLDPVAAYGGPGAGLGGPDWPCLLADVGTSACTAIGAAADVTALRFWSPDPDPARSGSAATSSLPIGAPPRAVTVVLDAAGARPGDVLSNAWGGRFDGLELPAFHGDAARVRVAPAYLPVAHFGAPAIDPPCTPRPADVILVLDASTSMRRPSDVGGTKMEAVVRSAGALVERLAAEGIGHRVAVAGFNDRAWKVLPLTADRRAALDALDALAASLAEGSRLDLGLLVGSTAADSRSRARRVMVLLSDGLPNRVPTPIPAGRQEDTVLRAAEAVRRMKIDIHAIGYGRPDAPDLVERVNPELLAAIVGPDGTSVVARDAAALHAAFEAIGADLACPKPGP